MVTIIALIAYAVFLFCMTVAFTGKDNTNDNFYVGKRNMGTVSTAMSVAATWIWAPALFTSAQQIGRASCRERVCSWV